MTAGEHNVAMAMKLYQSIQAMFRRFNPAGVRIKKIVITEELITIQLVPCLAIHSLFPHAEKKVNGKEEFYEQFDFGCRIVWEAIVDE